MKKKLSINNSGESR